MENLENEKWLPVEGYEGLYEVSNLGRVKSLGNGKSRNSKEMILKACKDRNGYLIVYLYQDGRKKGFLVHRLVAQAFIPNPNNLPEINHINEDKTDNRAEENLEWCDRSYNINYGTHNERMGKAKSKAVKQYSIEGEFIREWVSATEVKRQLGYSQEHICDCCNGKLKKSNGYVWKYTENE